MQTLSKLYYTVLFIGVSLWLGGGIGNLLFDIPVDVSLPIFTIGVIVMGVSFIPAKLSEREIVS
jgi:hypothetical protein